MCLNGLINRYKMKRRVFKDLVGQFNVESQGYLLELLQVNTFVFTCFTQCLVLGCNYRFSLSFNVLILVLIGL